MKKILIPGLLAGLIMLIVGMVLSQLINMILPGLMAEYQTAGLFRPWSDPLMSVYFAHPFIVGLVLAWVLGKVKGLLGGSLWQKAGGLTLGIFLVSTLPGMVISYSSFPLSLAMILSWTVSSVAQVYCGSLLLIKMNG